MDKHYTSTKAWKGIVIIICHFRCIYSSGCVFHPPSEDSTWMNLPLFWTGHHHLCRCSDIGSLLFTLRCIPPGKWPWCVLLQPEWEWGERTTADQKPTSLWTLGCHKPVHPVRIVWHFLLKTYKVKRTLSSSLHLWETWPTEMFGSFSLPYKVYEETLWGFAEKAGLDPSPTPWVDPMHHSVHVQCLGWGTPYQGRLVHRHRLHVSKDPPLHPHNELYMPDIYSPTT